MLFGYTAISFAFFGWRLLPHPGRDLLGYGHNPEIYVWSFSWWPHAIATLSNPLSTDSLYAPTGVNLAWTLTVPGLALVFTPLTAIVGPAVGPCCYRVGPEVSARFDPDLTRDGMLDLWAAAERALERAGVRRVERLDLCTRCTPALFFSHRRSGLDRGTQGVIGAVVG